MTNRQWIGRIVIALIVVAILVGGGCALYKYGYQRGLADNGEGKFAFYGGRMGFMHDMDDLGEMPHHDEDEFEHHMEEGFPMPFHDGSGFMQGKGGGMFGNSQRGNNQGFQSMDHFNSRSYFSSPLGWIVRLVVLGFFLWVVYVIVRKLFLTSGWQLSFKTVEVKEEKPEKEKKSKKDKK